MYYRSIWLTQLTTGKQVRQRSTTPLRRPKYKATAPKVTTGPFTVSPSGPSILGSGVMAGPQIDSSATKTSIPESRAADTTAPPSPPPPTDVTVPGPSVRDHRCYPEVRPDSSIPNLTPFPPKVYSQDRVHRSEREVVRALHLLLSKEFHTWEQIRDEIFQWTEYAEQALEYGENLRIRKPLQWVLDWVDAGAPIGNTLDALGDRVTGQFLMDRRAAVWPTGTLYIKRSARAALQLWDQPIGSDIDLPLPPSPLIAPLPELAYSPRSLIASPPPSPEVFPPVRRSNRLAVKPKQTYRFEVGGTAPQKTFSSSDFEDSDDLSSSIGDLMITQPEQGTAPGHRRSLSLPEGTEKSNLVHCCYLLLSLGQLILSYPQWCMSCFNGGRQIDCSFCPQAICFECLPELKKIPPSVLVQLTFRCTRCHVSSNDLCGTPYMVVFFI